MADIRIWFARRRRTASIMAWGVFASCLVLNPLVCAQANGRADDEYSGQETGGPAGYNPAQTSMKAAREASEQIADMFYWLAGGALVLAVGLFLVKLVSNLIIEPLNREKALEKYRELKGLPSRAELERARKTLKKLAGSTEDEIARAGNVLMRSGDFARATRCFLAVGDTDGAVECMQKQGKELEAGELLLKRGRPAEAARVFESAGFRERAAAAYYRAGRSDLAAKAYEACGRHLEAAACYENLGDLHSALRCYESAGELGKASQTLSAMVEQGVVETGEEARHLAELLASSGRRSRAAEYYILAGDKEKAFELFVIMGNRERATMLVEEGDEEFCSAVVDRVKERPELADESVRAFLAAGRPDVAGRILESKGDWRQAARVFESSGNLVDAARAYLAAGDLEDAAKSFEEIEDYAKAAEVHKAAGRLAKAAVCYEKAGLSYKAGKAWYELDNKERAMDLLEKVVSSQQGSACDESADMAKANRMIAEMLLDSGRYAEAEARLAELDGDGVTDQKAVHFLMAMAKLHQGKEREARDLLVRIEKDDPGYREARRIRAALDERNIELLIELVPSYNNVLASRE